MHIPKGARDHQAALLAPRKSPAGGGDSGPLSLTPATKV